jgi:hypothetical protein
MKRAACVLIAFVTVVLTSCTVGPKYARPSVPSAPTETFKEIIDGWKTAHPAINSSAAPGGKSSGIHN